MEITFQLEDLGVDQYVILNLKAWNLHQKLLLRLSQNSEEDKIKGSMNQSEHRHELASAQLLLVKQEFISSTKQNDTIISSQHIVCDYNTET